MHIKWSCRWRQGEPALIRISWDAFSAKLVDGQKKLLLQGIFTIVTVLPLWPVQEFSSTQCLPFIDLLAK